MCAWYAFAQQVGCARCSWCSPNLDALDDSIDPKERQTAVFSHLKCHWSSMVLANDNVTGETMPGDEGMAIEQRRHYLRRARQQYRQARRQQRSLLLEHMGERSGWHRKALIWQRNSEEIKRKPRRKQRGHDLRLPGGRCFARDLRKPGPHLRRAAEEGFVVERLVAGGHGSTPLRGAC